MKFEVNPLVEIVISTELDEKRQCLKIWGEKLCELGNGEEEK